MPHKIDQYVGNRLREYRTARGMSQQELANRIGISFQQLQKYERAANRIACSRLWEIGETLGAPIPFFFPEPSQIDAEDTAGSESDRTARRSAKDKSSGSPVTLGEHLTGSAPEDTNEASSLFDDQDGLSPQNVIRLARKIAAIRNKKVRTQILMLIDACANIETTASPNDPPKRRSTRAR